MAEHLTWWVGDREPPISDTITIDGVPVDLTAKTVTFKMRATGSTTLKVNAAVSFKDANGNWRYDWAASDLDTESDYLAWIVVTTGGKDSTVAEYLIRVLAHAPETNAYVEVEAFKSTAQLSGTAFADRDIEAALVAASRGIDDALGRRFYPDTDANQIRFYTPGHQDRLWVDDLITLTELATDPSGEDTYADVWAATDFGLEPWNAATTGKPYELITVRSTGNFLFPKGHPKSVKVTGRFGWSSTPGQIKTLTTLVAFRLLKRTREAPLGFIELGVDGAAVRASGFARDPEYQFLVHGLSREMPVG